MSEVARALLAKLFDRWQRASPLGKVVRSISVDGRDGTAYFATSGDERIAVHAVLENAAARGAIDIEMGRFAASHELKRIKLKDGQLLADFLGRRPVYEVAEEIEQKVRPALDAHGEEWLISSFERGIQAWQRGDSAFRLSLPGDTYEIQQLFAALVAVRKQQHVGLDLRTFCARFLGDSKALERLRQSFADVWSCQDEATPLSPDDLFAVLGLEKLPWPALLRGPLALSAPARTDFSDVRPFFGLPGPVLANVALTEKPPYILTIENMTSFVRYCQEVKDDGLVIYTNGFPTPSIQLLISRLSDSLDSGSAIYHWGDSDVRGIEILGLIQELCSSREVNAHMMDREPWRASGLLTASEEAVLQKLIARGGAAQQLSAKVLSFGLPSNFEQEHFDPRSPV